MKEIFIFLFIVFLILSCNDDNKNITYQQTKIISQLDRNDTLRLINKSLIITDRERISAYIKRRNWNMNESETGLFYEIYFKCKKIILKKGSVVRFNYRVELLDGTFCYSSDSSVVKELKIGYSKIERGLEEGLLMTGKGDKARFILPPHLAHGLVGDGKKIPARAIIVYYVEILDVIF